MRYYVASWGNDLNTGLTLEDAFQTLGQAFSVIIANDEIYIGLGGSALIWPLYDLSVDCTLVGRNRGNSSTIRVQSGNIFRVLSGATLNLDGAIFIEEATAQEPLKLDTGGRVEAYRVSFRMRASQAIYAVDGEAELEQATIVYYDPVNKSTFPALKFDAGNISIKNSIVSGFNVGLQRASGVVYVSEATDWNCSTPIAAGTPGDYDLFVNPEFITLDVSGVPSDPDVNLNLSPTSKCISAGKLLGYEDYSGPAPDLGAWETVFDVPSQYVAVYNILFFLWIISGSLDEIFEILQQTQANRALSTCDDPTMRNKYGRIADVFRPAGLTSDQFRAFLQVLFDTFRLLPAREVFERVVDTLFGPIVPGGEYSYFERDYYWQKRWNLVDDLSGITKIDNPTITVLVPPSLDITFDEFFFYTHRMPWIDVDGQWWRSQPGPITVPDNQTTYIYHDGTVDVDNFVVWQQTTNIFDIPLYAYILATVVASGGAITDIFNGMMLGLDSYANDETVVFNGYETSVNAPGDTIFAPSASEESILLRQILPRIVSAHKLAYMRLDPTIDTLFWKVKKEN